jgi:hypothetical protein
MILPAMKTFSLLTYDKKFIFIYSYEKKMEVEKKRFEMKI